MTYLFIYLLGALPAIPISLAALDLIKIPFIESADDPDAVRAAVGALATVFWPVTVVALGVALVWGVYCGACVIGRGFRELWHAVRPVRAPGNIIPRAVVYASKKDIT